MTSMMIQICGSHLASSYQKSGVHACLAGQEVGQSVKNAKKIHSVLDTMLLIARLVLKALRARKDPKA